jgi:hypothetical protein
LRADEFRRHLILEILADRSGGEVDERSAAKSLEVLIE